MDGESLWYKVTLKSLYFKLAAISYHSLSTAKDDDGGVGAPDEAHRLQSAKTLECCVSKLISKMDVGCAIYIVLICGVTIL
jgi:hypothetical protein